MSNKEYILKEMEDIKTQQKELVTKMELLQKEIEVENNKKEWWTPKTGEEYWFIRPDGISSNSSYRNDHIDRANCLNIYKTKEQAERQSFEELLMRKLKRFVFENNAIVDWSDDYVKYLIIYNHHMKKIQIEYYSKLQCFGQVYFTSQEIAEKAIEEFKEELIRYFTSDK